MIGADALLKGEQDRIIEYGERAKVLLEAATQLASGESVQKAQFKKDIEEFKQMLATDLNMEQLEKKYKNAELALKTAKTHQRCQSHQGHDHAD